MRGRLIIGADRLRGRTVWKPKWCDEKSRSYGRTEGDDGEEVGRNGKATYVSPARLRMCKAKLDKEYEKHETQFVAKVASKLGANLKDNNTSAASGVFS